MVLSMKEISSKAVKGSERVADVAEQIMLYRRLNEWHQRGLWIA